MRHIGVEDRRTRLFIIARLAKRRPPLVQRRNPTSGLCLQGSHCPRSQNLRRARSRLPPQSDPTVRRRSNPTNGPAGCARVPGAGSCRRAGYVSDAGGCPVRGIRFRDAHLEFAVPRPFTQHPNQVLAGGRPAASTMSMESARITNLCAGPTREVDGAIRLRAPARVPSDPRAAPARTARRRCSNRAPGYRERPRASLPSRSSNSK